MNARSLLVLAGCLLASLPQVRGDGFIIVERPMPVPIGHFPFAPLEVTNHHVEVKIVDPDAPGLFGKLRKRLAKET